MKKLPWMLAVPLLALAGSATARDGYWYRSGNMSSYVGVSAGVLRYDESGLDTISPSVIIARIGFPIAPNLAIEGRLGTGVSSDQAGGYSVKIDTLGGAYVKGSLPLAPTFSLYGVAGLATIGVNRNYADGHSTETGFSFGIGGDVDLPQNLVLNFEWTRFPSGNNVGYSYDMNAITAGVNWRF